MAGPVEIAQMAAPAALPMLGQLGGAAAGTLAAPFLGPAAPAGPFIGEAIGGGLGEAANQAIGLTERSNLQIALAAGAGPLGRGATGALRAARPFFSRRGGAELLNVIGFDEANAFFKGLRPTESATALFDAARKSGQAISAGKTLQAVDESIAIIEKSSPGARKAFSRPLSILQGLKERIKQQGGSLFPDQFQADLEVLGEIESQLVKGGGTGLKAIGKTKSAMIDDLVTTPVAEGSQLLRARQVFLRGKTVEEMEKAVELASQSRRGLGAAEQFNPQKVINSLKGNKFYEKAFTDVERAEIEGMLKRVNRIPALPPPPNIDVGSGRFLARGIGGAMAGGGAAVAGAPAAVAVGIGIAAPSIARFSRDFAVALTLKEGRFLIGKLLSGSDGAITPQIASLISGFVRAKMAEALEEQVVPTPGP